MSFFKFNPVKFIIILVLFSLVGLQQSCFPPNGIFDHRKQAKCVFFIPKTMEIVKSCNDDNFNFVSSLRIQEKYDTIKIVNGRPSDGFVLFESSEKISFPYQMNSIVKDKSKELIISLNTDKREYSYSLDMKPGDWSKDTLPFVFYYRQ
jgi:hypothetical protein